MAVVAALGAIVAVAAASASAQSVLPGGQVPIKVFHSPRTGAAAVLVPISIGRHHGYFILDTGAEKSMIDRRVAKQLGLRPIGRKHVLCGISGCARPSRSVNVPGWQLGTVALPPTHLVQGDLLALYPGPTLAAGLLGADMLSTFGKINIDFAASLLTLGDGNPVAPASPTTPAPAAPAAPGSGLVAN